MSEYIKRNSREFLLFLLFLFLFFSCKDNKSFRSEESQLERIENNSRLTDTDSITISVDLKPKASMGFDLFKDPFDSFLLKFDNPSNKDSTITRKIPVLDNYQIMGNYAILYENDHPKITKKFYLLGNEYSKFNFKWDKGYLRLKNKEDNIFLDKIYEDYRVLEIEIFESNATKKIYLKNKLDSLYNFYVKKPKKKNIAHLLLINDLQYYSLLQKIDPSNIAVETYLKNTNDLIYSGLYIDILYPYIKARIDTIDFSKLNSTNFSENYIELLSIGLYRFLSHEDNKGDKKYSAAVDWLKRTSFYKKHSAYIDKKVTPLENNDFKSLLKSVNLQSISDKKTNFSKIINQNSSDFYLLDFWATWCAPCIKGIKTMKSLDLPKNVNVISLSIDRSEDKGKWKAMSKNLNQNISYWLDEKNANTKSFFNFLELQSIPRYVLIDKNMNLIDQAFYHPQEFQFLEMLRDLKNHEYW